MSQLPCNQSCQGPGGLLHIINSEPTRSSRKDIQVALYFLLMWKKKLG